MQMIGDEFFDNSR